jgi:hypothetical protein
MTESGPDEMVRNPAAQELARSIRSWVWVLSCISAAFSGVVLVDAATAGRYPVWTGFVGAALGVLAVLVMVSRGWRRRNPELVLVPMLLGMVASQAARTAFVPDDDWVPLVVIVLGVVALVAATAGWWLARRPARGTR